MIIRLIHIINAGIFASIGVAFIVAAEKFGASLGIQPITSQGLTDFRATYGGMCLGLGGFFALAALGKIAQDAALWASIFVYGGLGIIRLGGMIVDNSFTPLLASFLAVEALLVGVSARALKR
jgi:hypothetical protein